MNRYYENSFWKDVKKIINHALMENVEQAILSIQKANTIRDIPKLKKNERVQNSLQNQNWQL